MGFPDTPEQPAADDPPAGFFSKTSNVVGMSIIGVLVTLFLIVGYMLDNPTGEPPTAEEQQRNRDMRACLASGQTVEECANPRLNP
ncbi:hypothetical protein LG943_07405 [Streptomonospora sp. S1-112]|uniref:Uncharacterized protein n=1 Tax=Streptomonospora mangrovi TaxID=2883123 RepID=A0A9X3NIP1_9ACTN|nr:hypothetical protein [Streptomonospora mangrovi]MDA0564152.1 hypothetical protein [Streptomonospora mangrovi]